jgi:hypothetical protein
MLLQRQAQMPERVQGGRFLRLPLKEYHSRHKIKILKKGRFADLQGNFEGKSSKKAILRICKDK